MQHPLPDPAKLRREGIRWVIILALNHARPGDCHEHLLYTTLGAIYTDLTTHELRREMDYLHDRQLIAVRKTPDGVWWSELTRHGVDVAEYTVDVEPGIARPNKTW